MNRTPPPGGGKSPQYAPATTTVTTSTSNLTTGKSGSNSVCTENYITPSCSKFPNPNLNGDLQRHLDVVNFHVAAGISQSQTENINSSFPPPHTQTIFYSDSYSQKSSSAQMVISNEANRTEKETECQLEKTNNELLEKNKYYENLCAQLRKDISLLKEENDKLKPNNAQPENYETDEDDLNIEVGRFENPTEEWKTVSNKKRNRESPGKENANQKQQKISPYWLSKDTVPTNRFALLQKDPECQNIPNAEHVSKPPPIYVDNVTNIKPLISLLDNIAKNQFELKNLKNLQVKIMAKNPEIYRKIFSELEKKNTEFFTFKLKEERSFKVILRNMHPSIDTEELKKELQDRGHEVTNIWNIQKRGTKEPLPLFDVDLKLSPNNKEIYAIKSLMHTRIIFEPPRPKKTIPQCTNCQQYGHTKSFCKRKPKCIKCAGSHLSKDCVKKNWETQVKCVLCEGNHPANYKGCSIYKEVYESQYASRRRYNNGPPTQRDSHAPEPNPGLISEVINPINSQKQNTPGMQINSHTQNNPNMQSGSNSQFPTQENSQTQPLYSNIVRGPTQNQYNIPQAAPINQHPQTIPNQQFNPNVAMEMINDLRGLMQQMQQMTATLMNILSKFIQN